MSERRTPYRTRPAADHTGDHNDLVAFIRQYVEWCGGWAVKIHGGAYQRAGLPDLLCAIAPVKMPKAERGMHPAEFVAIEVKTGRAELSKAQTAVRKELEAACVLYIEARTPEEVVEALVAAGLGLPLDGKRGA